MLAGGGIQGGRVFGASEKFGGDVKEGLATPIRRAGDDLSRAGHSVRTSSTTIPPDARPASSATANRSVNFFNESGAEWLLSKTSADYADGRRFEEKEKKSAEICAICG